MAKSGLSKLGPPGKILEELLSRLTGDGGSPEGEKPEIPRAKGSLGAVGGQAFFLPLYELFLTYGGIFRLIFGPKVMNFSSAPTISTSTNFMEEWESLSLLFNWKNLNC